MINHLVTKDIIVDNINYIKGQIISFNSIEEHDVFLNSAYPPNLEDIRTASINLYIDRLQEFTKSFLKEAMNENIALGISAEPLSVVETLTSSTAEISNALNLGVLQVAEDKIKTFDVNLIDGKYITEARLLEWRNKIRTFRKLQLVSNYKD